MKIINKAKVNFKYRLSAGNPIIAKTLYSNKVVTDILLDKLKVEKYVNKSSANIYEVITYTTEISNVGSKSVIDVYFRDLISKHLKFIHGSVVINGYKKKNLNPMKSIYIGDIEPNTKISISFDVIIKAKCNIEKIENYSTAFFEYIYNIEKPPKIIFINSNVVCTKVKNNLFRQESIDNILCIPYNYPKVSDIKMVKVKPIIEELKLIKTRAFDNDKKKRLYKLIIIGLLKYEVLYTYSLVNKGEKQYWKAIYNTVEGFSESILLPCTVDLIKEDIDVDIFIEDSSYKLYTCKKLYVNSNILIRIK